MSYVVSHGNCCAGVHFVTSVLRSHCIVVDFESFCLFASVRVDEYYVRVNVSVVIVKIVFVRLPVKYVMLEDSQSVMSRWGVHV